MTYLSNGKVPYRVGILNSHPIQYFAPFYRDLAQDPSLKLTVFFCSQQGLESYQDRGFGDVNIQWDIPLIEGYDHVFLPNLFSTKQIGGFFSLVNPTLLRELRRRQIQVLVIHGYQYATNLMAIAAARAFGIKILLRGDTNPRVHRRLWKSLIRRPLIQTLYTQIDGALAAGTRNAEHYRIHGVPEGLIFPMPFTVDNAYFQRQLLSIKEQKAFRRREDLDPTLPTILYASKMQPRKRASDLLNAFTRLRSQRFAAQLVFVGDGEERRELERQVRRDDVPDVHFAGFRNQSELPAWYSIADIFVLPSGSEPWGLVINEVMNAAVPVITTDEVGAAADLVSHGETGFTYPVGDIDTLAELLRLLLANPTRCRKMGQAARARIDVWSFEQARVGLNHAITNLLSSPHLASPPHDLHPSQHCAGRIDV